MAGEITLHQLLQAPVITKMVSRLGVRDSVMQNFFGMGIGGPNTRRQSGKNLGWDIFDKTRTLAKGRAPNTGPSTITRKPIGHVSVQAFRAHEKMHLFQDEIFRTRPLGTAIGNVDVRGQSYVKNQTDFASQRFRNAREFMISRIPRGGFGIKIEGEDHILVEKDSADATFTVDYQIPAANQSYLEMGTGSNIIDSPWSDPGTSIVKQLLKIGKASERQTGYPMKHIWINSTTLNWLLNNLELQAIGGSAYRIFDSWTKAEMNPNNGFPGTGYDIVFRAIPLWTFHVYDAVQNVDTDDSTALADSSYFIPNGKAVICPDPSSMIMEWIEGSEIVAENVMDRGKEVFGFHNWTTRVIDPAGWETKFLDIGIPALYIPKAICYATVGEDSED